MVVSEYNILYYFYKFNNEYFKGKLPIPNIKVISSYRVLGHFTYKFSEDTPMYDETIEISDSYDYTEDQLKDILVHEMIHYYLAYTNVDIHCTHGKEFKEIARLFNSQHRMNITPTFNINQFKLRSGKSNFMKTICTMF